MERWNEEKKRDIESGDYVMMYSDQVAAHKDTIIGVHNDHFQFSELMKRGLMELSKAALTVGRGFGCLGG